jgi:carboxypeptidase T
MNSIKILATLLICIEVFALQASEQKLKQTSIYTQQVNSIKTEKDGIAYKIFAINTVQARQIAISYHHALLEVNYDKGYIIADLDDKEITQLKQLGFQLVPATDWNQRYQLFLKKIAQSKSNNQQKLAGIPGFECYPTVEETLTTGEDLATQFPSLTEWIDIGDSWQKTQSQGGYDLMVLKITNKSIQRDKPRLFVHSSMHAREYAPAALNLDFAKLLLDEYSLNPDIRWIVDYHEVHLLFHMNPDGRKIAESGVLQRKNTNQMHCPQGQNSGTVGVDLNRNFAFSWNSTANGSSGVECDQTYRGLSGESEPETQAVSNYIRSLFPDSRGPNLEDAAPTDLPGMHLDIHSFSQLVLWPWGETNAPSPNDDGFVALGNKLAWFNGYTPQQSVGLYATDGTSDSVSYGELGVAAFTFELGTAFFQDCDDYNYQIKPDNLDALVYAAKASAAPYLLGHGPDFLSIKINGSEKAATVAHGSSATLTVAASANLTSQQSIGRSISDIEYSVDTPIWQSEAQIRSLTAADNFDSAVESAAVDIDTTNLSTGRHTVYVRAINQDGQAGVTSAIDLIISDNNSPVPSFSSSCSGLRCSFDASQSSDSDGAIIGYNWFYGDGNSVAVSTDNIQNYTYTRAGTYTVTLAVTDNSHNRSSVSAEIEVTQPVAPPETETESSSGGGSFSVTLLALAIVSTRRRLLAKLSNRINQKYKMRD